MSSVVSLRPRLELGRLARAGAGSLDDSTSDPRARSARIAQSLSLDPKTSAQVLNFARVRRLAPFEVLAAGVIALLSRLSGADEVAVALFADADRGPSALRARPAEPKSFDSLLRGVSSALAAPKVAPAASFSCAIGWNRDAQVRAHDEPMRPPVPDSGAELSLSFAQREADGVLEARAVCDGEHFDQEALTTLWTRYQQLLRQCVAGPEQDVHSLALLDEQELAIVVRDWNRTEAGFRESRTLHGAFIEQAQRTPEATALLYAGGRLSYRELDEKSASLAEVLRSHGALPGMRVALCVERSPLLLIALLAILRTGAGYVPLDPAYPAERLAFMLEDCGAALLLTTPACRGRAAANGLTVLCVAPDLTIEITPGRSVPAASEPVAYVIYTSGSTGRPKGVMIGHRSCAALFHWADGVFSAAQLAGVLAATSVCFDISVFELFYPLSRGGALVLVDNVLLFPSSPHAEAVTLVNTVPSLMSALLQLGPLPRTVKTVTLVGEPLRRSLADRIYAQPAVETVHNLYGPTEATVFSTACVVERASHAEPSIGRPISNTRAYILDERQMPVGPYRTGELYLAGHGLALGYYGRPELTRERFVPDPFQPGEWMYKTGDLAAFRADGEIDFAGRNDGQVKIRGHRIELDEVEACLHHCAGVFEAAVSVRRAADDEASAELVAYVVPRDGRPTGAEPVFDAERQAQTAHELRRTLPDHMVPSVMLFVRSLPRSANGKVDRRALPPVLVPPPLNDVGQPTDSDEELLALLLEEQGLQAVADTAIAPRAFARSDLPLSFAQQRLWFLDQLQPGNPFYNVPLKMRLRGPLDVVALGAALQSVVERHEALRTRFSSNRGVPMLSVESEVSIALGIMDLSSQEPNARAESVQRLSEEQAQLAFDLSQAPLVRAVVLRESDQQHTLLVTLHHIVCDGWSLGVLTRELGASYRAFRSGQRAELPPLSIQYPDFAIWQRGWLQGERLEEQLAYWQKQFRTIPPPLELPLDHPRTQTPSHRGDGVPFRLDARSTIGLRALCRETSVSLFALLAAALSLLLRDYTGQEELVLGSPYANRNAIELEPLIGFFVNTVPLKIDLAGCRTFRDLLVRTKAVAEGAFAHQELPFEKLVEAVQPERQLARTPLFQVLLALQNAWGEPLEVPGLEAELVVENRVCRFDLEVFAWEEGDTLRGSIAYPTELFERATIERLTQRWTTLLAEIAVDSSRDLALTSALSPLERSELMKHCEGARLVDPELRLHEGFAQQARLTPHAIALSSESRQWTYRELNRRAARLATRLKYAGLRPDMTVGVLCDSSPLAWLAVLAILRAGGAYVPLDIEQPDVRSELVLAEAGVELMVTELACAERLPGYRGQRLFCDDPELADAGLDAFAAPAERVSREHLFCVLYTSGSTGRPKGVCLTHGLVEDTVRRYAEGTPRRTLQFARLGFDVSFEETFPTWALGGTVITIARELRRDVAALSRYLVEHRVEKAIFPVTWLQLLAEVRRAPTEYAFSEVIATGEQLQISATMRSWFKQLPDCRLRNVYGPTEAQVITDHVLPRDPDSWPELPSIGRPLPNFSAYVLNPRLELLPFGAQGELWAGNATSARGYMGQPGLTAERFLPNAFGASGTRLYRTGDVVRLFADGTFEFKGRKDGQVKIRGQRVELGEVEAQLLRCTGVEDAVAMARRGQWGSYELVAAVCLRDHASLPASLAAELRASLPEYMVPSRIVVRQSFPLNDNGKVDRAALLREIDEQPEPATPVAEPPRTPTEQLIARAWQEVLGRGSISRDSGFFALGGHSLTAVQVASRLNESLGRELPVRLLFEFPVLCELALAIDDPTRWEAEDAREELVL